MIKGTKMVPPSVRSLFFRSKEKSVLVPQIRITDDDILSLIDEIYIQTSELLSKNKYNNVIETFFFLSEYDACFKKIISSQLSNKNFGSNFDSNGVIYTEDIMNFLVIIQSYFNSFRINLLSEIIKDLNAQYNFVLDKLKYSFHEALAKFNKTNTTMMYLVNRLKSWKEANKGDEYIEYMYRESKSSIVTLKLHAAQQLQKLIHAQLLQLK